MKEDGDDIVVIRTLSDESHEASGGIEFSGEARTCLYNPSVLAYSATMVQYGHWNLYNDHCGDIHGVRFGFYERDGEFYEIPSYISFSLPIYEDVTIQSAVLKVTPENSDYTAKPSIENTISCAKNFPCGSFCPDNPRTNNKTTWIINDPEWSSEVLEESPDFSSAVQEAIDGENWSSCSKLLVFVDPISQNNDTGKNYENSITIQESNSELHIVYTIDPSCSGSEPGGIFYKDLNLLWQNNYIIIRDVSFYWGIGELISYWYRVIGAKKENDPCDEGVEDTCCQKYVVNIKAKTPSEICEKLKQRNLTWPIQSVDRFSIPADSELAKEHIETYGSCNNLIPVDISKIPECIEGYVDFDVRVTFNFNMKQSVDGDKYYTSGNGNPIERTISISGVADASSSILTLDAFNVKKYVPSLRYHSDVVPFTLSGVSGCFLEENVVLKSMAEDHTGVIQIGGSMEVVSAVYNVLELDAEEISPISETITSCDCFNLPQNISLIHNLQKENILKNFLDRNSIEMGDTIIVTHNKMSNSWQGNLHYIGFSPDTENNEKWDFLFNLQCTDRVGGEQIGQNIWVLGVSVFRTNLLTDVKFVTRIVLSMMPEEICSTRVDNLEFGMEYNTQDNSISSYYPLNAIVYKSIVYDDIGLFRNPYWISNPNLKIGVSQSGFELIQDRVDLQGFIDEEDLTEPLPTS